MLTGFKQFVLRGNVVDLAVAVVIGGAFGTVVSSFVGDVLTPLVTAFMKMPDFSRLTFTLNSSEFHVGRFLNALASFVLVSAAVYFVIVAPMNAIMARHAHPPEAPPPPTKTCPECLTTVPAAARRCAACTTPLT